MDRREFCRLAGCAMIGVCAASVTGCARLLDWSEARRGAGAVERSMSSLGAGEVASAEETSTPEPAPADLVVYRGDDPAANVRAAIAAAGGMGRFVAQDARVVIKPNVLTSRTPEYAATTNPDVVGELTRMCLEAGAAEVVVLDRPTAPARTAFETSGVLAAVESAGGAVKFLSDRNFENVSIPEGRVLTEWPLVTDVFEADTFINVPIAKTHGMAGLTMSMKNLMGIMGGTRGLVHQDFHQKIVDLATLVKPHLVVLDAHRILTANGPTGGNLADVAMKKTVVVGTNQASVDAYGTTLFGMTPDDLPYLVRANEQGLGETDLSELVVTEGTS